MVVRSLISSLLVVALLVYVQMGHRKPRRWMARRGRLARRLLAGGAVEGP